jgi:hypothetical protein
MKKLTLLLLVAPLALAACGGGKSTATPNTKVDPLAYVKQSASKTAELKSEHMTMSATISAGPTNLTMTGSGDFANTTKQGQMDAAVAVAGHNVQMHEVVDGTTIYMNSPIFASRLPGGKTWLKIDMQKAGSKLGIDYSSLMGQSPTSALKQLEAAGSVKSLGTETIDGTETTHYQVTNLDLSKIPQAAKLEALAHPKYGPIDVWIGKKDSYVYRESFSFTYSAAGQSASMTMRVDFSKFGESVNVSVPPASDVFDATSLSSGGFGG